MTPVTRLVILLNGAHASHVRRYTQRPPEGLPGNGTIKSQIRGAAADTGKNSSVFRDTVIPRQGQYDGWARVFSHHLL